MQREFCASLLPVFSRAAAIAASNASFAEERYNDHVRVSQQSEAANRTVKSMCAQAADAASKEEKDLEKNLSLQERNQGEKVHARTRKLPSHSSQDENRQKNQCIKDSMDLATVRRVRLHLPQRLESAIVCLLVCLRQGHF